MTTTITSDPFAAFNTKKPMQTKQETAQDIEDRFLKLLVTQMQNQDPLNPLDNAQVTTQMAQTSTVTGIEKLNGTIESMSRQFVQLQAMQSAALVGKEVTVAGNKLSINEGVGRGGYEISAPATSVRIEVIDRNGKLVDTISQSGQTAGLKSFEWKAPSGVETSGLSFRVSASNGTSPINANPLMRDRVDAVRTGGDQLTLDLRNSGAVPYGGVKAFN